MSGCVSKIMSVKRFKIIRSTFHPEARYDRNVGDELPRTTFHTTIQKIASDSFIPGTDMAFYECGIASQHHLKPVRMFNASKPQQF